MSCNLRLILAWLAIAMLFQTVQCISQTSEPSVHPEQAPNGWHFLWDQSTLYDPNRSYDQVLKRIKRSNLVSNSNSQSQSVDTCQAKVEVITPYYATSAKGKLRKVVNSELMQQAVQVETCSRTLVDHYARCDAQADCGCEQKYKWHRLLVIDPKDAGFSRGLFMDWFLFPSSCVCRCRTTSDTISTQFLKKIRSST